MRSLNWGYRLIVAALSPNVRMASGRRSYLSKSKWIVFSTPWAFNFSASEEADSLTGSDCVSAGLNPVGSSTFSALGALPDSNAGGVVTGASAGGALLQAATVKARDSGSTRSIRQRETP